MFKHSKNTLEKKTLLFIFQSIEKDGTMSGYDLQLLEEVGSISSCPFTFLGGAKSFDSIKEVNDLYGPIGIGASSIYIFKGPHKAVLINYPTADEKMQLLYRDLKR